MKIGYLVPQFPGQTHAFFWREARAIEGWGIPVEFLSSRASRPEDNPHAFDAEARARTHYAFPVSVAAFGYLLRKIMRWPAALRYALGLKQASPVGQLKVMAMMLPAAELARHCQRTGITHIHIHSCADAAHLGALIQCLTGITYSLTLHGDLDVYGQDHRAKMGSASLVTVVTAPLREQVLTVLPGAHVPVVTMGVDTEWFEPSIEPKSDTEFTLASVTRLNVTKGHKYTLRALAKLRDQGHKIRFLVAGEGPYREEIEAEIKSLDLDDQVTLLGSLSEKEVLDLLQSADALALTSFGLGEAAPVAVMEAMACGLPVVCSQIGGTPDMIEDGKNGLLTKQEDSDDVADALRLLLTDPTKRAAIGKAARLKAVEDFDYRPLARRLIAEIENALGDAY